jgi:hypothetical protein
MDLFHKASKSPPRLAKKTGAFHVDKPDQRINIYTQVLNVN